jgi:hypothetical protein
MLIPKRTSGKTNAHVKAKDIWKNYLKSIKPIESLAGGQTIGSYKLTQKEYSGILKDVNKEIIDAIILENFELKLPCGLGYLSVKQKPLKYELDERDELITKSLSIDYKALKDLWSTDDEAKEKRIKVYHTNENTNGNRMAFFWSKMKSHCFGIKPYYFKPCRDVKRLIASYLKDENLNLSFYINQTRKDRNILMYNSKNKV